MRISKAYWIWGLFKSRETKFLNEIQAKVQTKLTSPIFNLHITIAGPYSKIDDHFLHKLRTFVERSPSILLDVKGYNFKQEMFESFFISIKDSENLKDLRENIYNLNNFNLKNNYSPHISLTYGNHGEKEKQELMSKLPELYKPIKMNKIALVEVDEDINLWRILEEFDLN